MLNPDVDALIKKLEELRLERANAIIYLEEVNKVEIEMLKDLKEAKAKAEASKRGVLVRQRRNPLHYQPITWRIRNSGDGKEDR